MRACRTVTVLGWPGAVALRSAVHPAWGAGLSAGGAAASLACEAALALLLRRRGREARLAERVAGLEEQVSALAAALAASLRYAGAAHAEPRRGGLRAVPGRHGRDTGPQRSA